MYSGKSNSSGKKCYHVQGNKKPPAPFGLKIYKGYKNVMMRRDFVDFLINHPVATAFENYLRDTLIPDEHLYATLSRIKFISGSTKNGV